MTFKEWINNPGGKGASVVTAKQMIQQMYTKKFEKINLRELNTYTYFTYRGNDDYTYYIHIKVPSEVIPKFYYDVVIEFSTANPALAASQNLDNYDIAVFSNDPAFIFTHVHAWNEAGLVIKDLLSRLPKEALKKKAVVRNPKDEIMYVKSLYFAYLIMKSKGLFLKVNYQRSLKYSKKDMLSKIEHASDKIQARQDAEEKLKAEERKKKREEQKVANDQRYNKEKERKASIKHNVGYTQYTKGSTKANTVKKTKRI